MFEDVKLVHPQIGNMVALSYIKKMGNAQKKVLSGSVEEIWYYLIVNGITITVEYLPCILNVEAAFQSQSVMDSSEWNPEIFRMICKALETPEIDLFASGMLHQLPIFISWKLDPFSRAVGTFQKPWRNLKGYAVPSTWLIEKFLRKVRIGMATTILIPQLGKPKPSTQKPYK